MYVLVHTVQWRESALYRAYLVSEHDAHHGDEEAEEGLQLPHPVLVDQQEREGIADRDQHASPQRNSGGNRAGWSMLPLHIYLKQACPSPPPQGKSETANRAIYYA